MSKKKERTPCMRVSKSKSGYRIVCDKGFEGLSETILSHGKTKNVAMVNMVKLLLNHIRGLETQVDAMCRIEKYLVNLIENNRGY